MLAFTQRFPQVPRPNGRRFFKRAADALRVVQELNQAYETLVKKEPAKTGEMLHALFDARELDERLAALVNLPGENQQALLKAYRKLEQNGPLRKVAQAPHPRVLEDLLQDFPNFAEVTRWVQQQLHLCRLATQQSIRLPAILLNGPPGVGKTAYSQQLANRLGVRFESIDLSASNSSHHLVGLDSGYSSSHPGRIWQSLQHDTLSVTWVLDEIDKMPTEGSQGGSQYLLGLLEPVSAVTFTDNWAALPINASWIFFLATSNQIQRIEEPLLSRFTVFDIPLPDAHQLRKIVRSIYQGYLDGEPWGASFQPTLDEAVVAALEGYSPRDIRHLLRAGAASAASKGRNRIGPYDIPVDARRRSPHTRIGFV